MMAALTGQQAKVYAGHFTAVTPPRPASAGRPARNYYNPLLKLST